MAIIFPIFVHWHCMPEISPFVYMRTSGLFLLLAVMMPYFSIAQSASDDYWSPVSESAIRYQGKRQITPQKYITYRLSVSQLQEVLSYAVSEQTVKIQESKLVVYLPSPNGAIQAFRVVESPVMSEALSKQFPDIKTYSLLGLTDPSASGKMDFNAFGFHANVRSVQGDYFIDPYATDNQTDYIVYYTQDFTKDPEHIIPEAGLIPEDLHGHHGDLEGIEGEKKNGENEVANKTASAACVGDRLRTYRLAVACTGEYAQAATGNSNPTVAQVLSRVVTTVNRVNSVYETEVAIRLVLIDNNTDILFTNPSTDPFSGNNNASVLIQESQSVISGQIGASNYDVGHTFSTGGGGLAQLGSVCTTSKARGITGSPSPVGDPYDIDYVAHELGHQFRGNHTFNGNAGSCSGNRNASTSVEPGSGITIMAYAGLCGGGNLASNSIPYFHAISYDEMVNFVTSGSGSSCGVSTTTGNNAPVVSAGTTYTVPKQTAFELKGTATDADGDAITYSWEALNPGAAAGNWNSGNVPYFRSYAPDSVGNRLFPRMSVILTGSLTGTRGEYYPQSAQTLLFRLTARDNKAGGGGVCYENSAVVVTNDGPFKITDPNSAGLVWYQGAWPIVSWDVAGTNNAPISCDRVNILISLDNGVTFQTLIADTENDGSHSVWVPTVTSNVSTCRLRIECANNVFFDVNDFNFSISSLVSTDALTEAHGMQLMIQPNPSHESVQISTELPVGVTGAQLVITDIRGKELYREVVEGSWDRKVLDASHFSAGVYLMRLESNTGHITRKWVVE